MDNLALSVVAIVVLNSVLIALAGTMLYYKIFAYARNRKTKAVKVAYQARQKAQGVYLTSAAPDTRSRGDRSH